MPLYFLIVLRLKSIIKYLVIYIKYYIEYKAFINEY